MNEQDSNLKLINIVLVALCIILAALGIAVIIQSNIIYSDSLNLTNTVLTKTGYKMNSGQAPNYSGVRDGYAQALLYFTLSMGCIIVILLLPRITMFSIGPSGLNFSLQALQQNVNSLVTQNNSLTSTSTGAGGIPLDKSDPKAIEPIAKTDAYRLTNLLPGNADPQKGRWGGKAEKNCRRLTADIQKSSIPGFFKVYIKVESTDTKSPLTGSVKFHLHPSFDNPNPVITVQNGVAMLYLKKVVGHFTLGVETDEGKNELELDLSNIKNKPEGF